jgi:RNA-directed DNA polymerase
LRKGADVWILDADIKGAFDHISHEYIMNTIGNIPGRELIKQWLKAGYIEAEIFHPTNSGTPQGGIASPLLANIALNGMEALLSQFKKVKEYAYFDKKKGSQRICRKESNKYGFIRYADDFLITATRKEDIEAIQPIIQDWLKQRGLELNPDKTKLVHIEEGFNYLGFNIRQYRGKCLITPEKKKVKALLARVRNWLKDHPSHKPEAVIKHLNPILKGWANYYKHVVSARVFASLDHDIWAAVFNWCRRRHPRKGKRWVVDKYFKTLGGQKWYFATSVKNRQGQTTTYSLVKLASIPIERHVKVKNQASPDDPALKTYWYHRQTRQGTKAWSKGSKHYQVAQAQAWRCPVCNEHLFNGEQLQTHHLIKVMDGGSDRADNLLHLHKTCHQHLHMGTASKTAEGLSRMA